MEAPVRTTAYDGQAEHPEATSDARRQRAEELEAGRCAGDEAEKVAPFGRLYFRLLAIGGIVLALAGAGVIWLGISAKLGAYMIVLGIGAFALSTPSMAQGNGYRI